MFSVFSKQSLEDILLVFHKTLDKLQDLHDRNSEAISQHSETIEGLKLKVTDLHTEKEKALKVIANIKTLLE